MRSSVVVGFAFVAWTLALGVLLVRGGAIDLYVVLLLIGLLVLRELTTSHAPRDLNARIGLFVFAGALAFVFVVVQRVREILNL